MCEKIRIWTRQDEGILNVLKEHGRYIVKEEYITNKMENCSDVFLDVYKWYTKKAQEIVPKPHDVKYPIWVSISANYMLQPVEGSVVLELLIDRDMVITMDVEKWGRIVNYWYVPISREDETEHDKLLKKYGLSDDSSAYMSNFYPQIKRKIIKSWDRLFDNSYDLSDVMQGTIWEVKEEWIQKIIR
ncbi:DUF3841 domain-containing protein [Wukongibacter baidiensis]|uniref:DUF3841 domain-containing protein n=1 Tax=Wukongibacter baidiensis TaxID=1723361 RepID=UPI003D7FAB73